MYAGSIAITFERDGMGALTPDVSGERASLFVAHGEIAELRKHHQVESTVSSGEGNG